VPESDPEEDLEEDDDEDPEEDPADYPADRGDMAMIRMSYPMMMRMMMLILRRMRRRSTQLLPTLQLLLYQLLIQFDLMRRLIDYLLYIPSPPLPKSSPVPVLSPSPPASPIPPTSSPPLLLPSTNRREDRPEVTLPPRKTLGIALGPWYEVGMSSSAAAARLTGGCRADYGLIATLNAEIRRDLKRYVGYRIT
ncbi:hypothetical protein Tco_1322852, partial [Tanacetum coccineum]